MDDLTAIRQRAEAASAGWWWTDREDGTGPIKLYPTLENCGDNTCGGCIDWGAGIVAEVVKENDALFIASARTDIPYLLDRIEVLERVLVTARTALERLEWIRAYEEYADGWQEEGRECPWCGARNSAHMSNCKRQQALTEIAGVLDAEPCKHERWMTEVERGSDGILGIQTGGDLFVKSGGECTNCGATERAW